MKRLFGIFLCLVLVFAMTGCGEDSSSGQPESSQPESSQPESSQPESSQTEETTVQDQQPAESQDRVDVDLTALSSTMVYAEVYNMMVSPETYIGKTVKMKGQFAYYHDEKTDNYYFACIIQDATACCAQGIEFVLTDDYVYPDDYPGVDEEISVIGVFDTYQEGNKTYCTLRNAKLI